MVAQPVPQERVAIYVRVSTDKQEEEGTSLGSQEERARAYCQSLGYTVSAVYRETYSGFELHRPELNQLREAIRASSADVVVAYAVDRLSRNQAHLAILIHEMDTAGLRYEFVTETFENTAVGRFILSAKAFAAEIEREKFLERSQRGMRARAEAGKLLGRGPAPYGYRWNADRSGLEIDPTTAPCARRIFREMAEGGTLRRIIDGLERDRVPTPGRSPHWQRCSVRAILANQVYIGVAQAFRETNVKRNGKWRSAERPEHERVTLPEGTIPPLIDEATWRAAHAQIEFNTHMIRRPPRDPEGHLLRSFITCGYCGGVMVAHWHGGCSAYRCGRAYESSHRCANRGSVGAKTLEADVWRRVKAALLDPERVAGQVAELLETGDDSAERELVAIDRALAALVQQQGNLVNSLTLVTGSAAALIAEKLNSLDAQRERLEAEREDVAARVEQAHRTLKRLNDFARGLMNVRERVGDRLDSLDHAGRRDALTWIGLQVKVYNRVDEPRWTIRAAVSLDDEPASGVLLGSRRSNCIGP